MIMLKKINNILFFFLLLVIGCDEPNSPTITNKTPLYRESEMYLYGWYNDKNQINLTWYDYYGCNSYDISIPEIGYENTTNTQEDHYHYINDIDYNPGYYFTAYVDCSDNQGVDYYDSVIVKTKHINPIDNIIVHVGSDGYSDSLTFNHSPDTDIYKWYFYNFLFDQNDPNTLPYYFKHTHNEQSEWQQDINPLNWESKWPEYAGTNKLDYYKYTKTNIDDNYCYMIKIQDEKNYSTNSHIVCNNNSTRKPIDITQITSISNNLPRRIIIEWNKYTDLDFYRYVVWRSEYENMPQDSTSQLAVIIENNQTIYHDRYNVSDGKKWYYKIELENQYGESKFSDIKVGITRP